MSTTRIAFIGLGNMGGPMAINLARASFAVQAFDLDAAACARVAEHGARIAESALAAVEGAEVVISMLPASRHVESLYLGGAGEPGLFDALPAGTLVIDCSTIAPASAQKLAEAGKARSLAVLDAPVSGGTAGAAAGTLTFMVGGDESALARAEPILDRMGQNIFHAGGAGAGQSAKLCNNMLLGILMIGTSEALNLGRSLGLDPAVLAGIMKKSSGANWVLEKYNPVPGVMDNVPAARGYSGGFGTDLMLKDLGLALEAAIAKRAPVPLGGLAESLYAAHSAAGNGGLDFSSVITALEGRPRP
ncbi:3-hydroxyisobutyrate dehydrogenase [Pseudothauera nasutitermitis]|uniref:3-hydroxyisobutyrate dehydrogenase n=1 Tax=Pseudothauera nasutitermitis TaxID=2565930 RepID=A0A4S4AZ43_9RHOO|nr:3-hydroxyisobutyrate dehydrogenase [Pseudothauera nasutitermitis]THF65439.1 3-hydroxyisobutyrate dehydrogenase [Pseudothauera nasutitermitis]